MPSATVNAILNHCESEVERLRTGKPRTSNALAAQTIVELMVASMALDNEAFSEFVEMVVSARTSIREMRK